MNPFKVLGIILLASATSLIQAKECFKAPREIGPPNDGLIYRSELTAAKDSSPESIDFRSSEQFMVSLIRLPLKRSSHHSETSASLSLTIFLKDPSTGQLDVYCEIQNFDLDLPFHDARFFIYSNLAQNKDWRIQLIDHGNSHDPKYKQQDPLKVEIVKFPVANLAQDAYGKPNVPGFLNLTCESFFARMQEFKPDGPSRDEITLGQSLRRHTFFVRSVGPVQVEFQTDMAKVPAILAKSASVPPTVRPRPNITMAVKEDDIGPFTTGCGQPGIFAGRLDAVQGTLTRPYKPSNPPLWRIDLEAPMDMDYDTKVVLRYPTAEHFSDTFPTEFQCSPPSTARTTYRSSNTNPFAGATVLKLGFLDPEKMLTPQAKETVLKHVLFGMALWRPICYLCTPDQLVLARVDGKTFILQSALNAIDAHYAQTDTPGPPPQFVGGHPFGKYDMLEIALNARNQSRGTPGNSGYIELLQPTLGLKGLCADNFEELPQTLQRIRSAIGCKIDEGRIEISKLSASTQLIFRTTPLDGCITNTNTIACESSALKIEFNAKDYTFVSHFSQTEVVGKGLRKVDLLHVLAHEIGHWIGVGHLEQRGSLMSESMSGSRCLDSAATNALNILAAGGDFPSIKPQALLWEEPIR